MSRSVKGAVHKNFKPSLRQICSTLLRHQPDGAVRQPGSYQQNLVKPYSVACWLPPWVGMQKIVGAVAPMNTTTATACKTTAGNAHLNGQARTFEQTGVEEQLLPQGGLLLGGQPGSLQCCILEHGGGGSEEVSAMVVEAGGQVELHWGVEGAGGFREDGGGDQASKLRKGQRVPQWGVAEGTK
jgi:hypothetical protein